MATQDQFVATATRCAATCALLVVFCFNPKPAAGQARERPAPSENAAKQKAREPNRDRRDVPVQRPGCSAHVADRRSFQTAG